ncbi:3-hydroxyacyl-CoA dehydrogenase/enoyl-CoA hydratase family protein [Neolewinella lacunae]|uniref:3-hydroxyacyl-CoA dehydrogenase/enoyl-CoA hydratase family protein n=1 Tax=Neolewinella lacunae TaxID=1517758 RepID=A0A923PR14_9BACT|nr:3-hydroxyacyl-CoA dehydrogenase/enoyl-CoA hydratase family protein [Neolewinella lacunae]MBC6995883.1 3-hydroxyacyl-CoA dehydrogenase/enoyl-CoA hydratase family protein [Neolewinella lacunae]MDN3636425.1 3-hydroxyacyl-CoA dehydrogenase/enoyl-CoA hydratase family protein [Neolewinella lacunae]
MQYRLKKVAVLGSGVMGSGIACHLANIGLDVLMLDIVPFNLSDEEKKHPAKRNSIVDGALAAALKSKPAALFKSDFASRITTGNFDDDFAKVADADWIIEVVIERLDIKRQILEKVDTHRKAGSLVTSNTSSIPIHLLAEGRSEDFRSHFCGTHFFNPPRYLRLFEVIPHASTRPDVVDFFMHYGDVYLGKQTVLCKDTPGFIGNRIGVMSGVMMMDLTLKYDMSIEEVDAITGSLIGRPNTATYRLQDLVGIDTSAKVSEFVMGNVSDDEYIDAVKGKGNPAFMDFLLQEKFYGNKSGQGFYKKTAERDEAGKSIIHALNLKTLEYAPATNPRPAIGKAKMIEDMGRRMQSIVNGEEREHKFLREYFAGLIAYAANRVPEIADDLYSVDDAMRTGYFWEYGPFETWDQIGLAAGIAMIEEQGGKVADWVKDMQAAGHDAFYRVDDGKRQYYDLATKAYQPVPSLEPYIILDTLREKTPVIKNASATVHDLGDGVMGVEFTSKSNSIDDAIGEAINEAIDRAEGEGWQGIVIGNNGKNFTVGANLMNVGMVAMQQDWKTLDAMVNGFQQLNMKIKTCKVPVVVATQGYVFGGGCEISMHADAGVYAAESYIGLVEVGVGLIPGGGGTKEMALRASDKFFEGDVQMPTLIDAFQTIATAKVSTSAAEAFDFGYLLEGKDFVEMNLQRNIGEAKHKVLELAREYVAPSVREDITVLGRAGLAALYTAINEFLLGKYISEYDAVVARHVANILCGGELTQSQTVSEQYLLDLEREAFLSLLGNQKTLERIQYTLQHNKPLRN